VGSADGRRAARSLTKTMGRPTPHVPTVGTITFQLADGEPVNPASFSNTFDRLVARSGMPRIRLHDLRHTYATLALRLGTHPVLLSERLGHSSIAVIIDRYSHVIPSIDRQAADIVAQLILPRPG
jgi:integrase